MAVIAVTHLICRQDVPPFLVAVVDAAVFIDTAGQAACESRETGGYGHVLFCAGVSVLGSYPSGAHGIAR